MSLRQRCVDLNISWSLSTQSRVLVSLIALARRNALAEIELLVAKDYVETAKKGDTVTGIVSQVIGRHMCKR